ncbi:S1C family serine protease [Antribacter gilvus]|uniref:S1C family serine protease n=1 Tax=Antribacter gilvus TaxID=2304675 RepID=UPI001F0C7A22|nr:trypsin-like peptidase domain-containing protein [Antribacter gilvus]
MNSTEQNPETPRPEQPAEQPENPQDVRDAQVTQKLPQTPAQEARSAAVPATEQTQQIPPVVPVEPVAPPVQHVPAGQVQHVQPPQPADPAPGATGAPGAPRPPSAPYANPYSLAPKDPEGEATTTRKRRGWAPLVSVAAVAAVLASAGTAGILTASDDGSAGASLAAVGTRETDSAPVSSSNVKNPDWPAVTSAVAPSVVAIQVASQAGGSVGSGVILDADGRILTNNHVVAGAANGTVQVTLTDGRVFEAEIVGTDPTTDLAVVQLQDAPENLEPASFGDSDAVAVGEPVLAVGNPLGLANTATTGIVSALDRPVTASGEDGGDQVVTNAIQIDAAINPGNSGGPLFNASGQVIGITSSIATLSSGLGGQGGSIGLGFAIPVNLARSIGDQLVEDGTAEHAFLGVSMTDGTATADDVTRRGAQVEEVSADSPAQAAGLQAGDVIVAFDEDPVNGAESLTGYVRERSAGDTVTITVVRDGAAEQVEVTLAVREDAPTQQQPEPDQGSGSGSGSDQGSGSGSDPTLPDNIPDWLRDLLPEG